MKRTVVLFVAGLICASASFAAEPTGDDYLNFFKPLVGEWTVKAQIGDKAGEGTFSCKLSPTKNCLVWCASTIAPYSATQSVDGFDPATKKWKGCAFTSAGDHVITTCVVIDPKSLKGNEASFKVEAIETTADGKTNKWQSKNTYIWVKDQCTLLITEQTKNDEKVPDDKYVLERKK